MLTCLLQLSLSQPQVDCITTYIRSLAAAQPHSVALSALHLSSSSPSQSSPSAQRSLPGLLNVSSSAAPVTVLSDDEDDVAEVVALLASARLVPTSSRRPIAAMLCAAGIGSAEALMLAVDRDPSFLSNQVLLRVIAG